MQSCLQTTTISTLTNPPCPQKLQKPSQEDKLIILVFYGVACLGKTTFTKMIKSYCKTHNIRINCISRDQIATPIIGKYKEDNPNVTDKEKIWFDNCGEITALFHEEILELIKSTKKGSNLLVIDDGRIDPNLLKSISNSQLLPSHDVEIIAVYPKNSEKFEISEGRFVPFSKILMLNLCYRSLMREAHETMNYKDDKTLQIVLSFTMLYEGTEDFVTNFKNEATYSRMIQVPFITESEFKGNGRENEIFEEFEILLKRAYLSIKAPFEYLKESDPTDLDNLALFLRNEEKMKELEGLLSYGQKDRWIEIFDGVCTGFGQREDGDKENDVNVSN